MKQRNRIDGPTYVYMFAGKLANHFPIYSDMELAYKIGVSRRPFDRLYEVAGAQYIVHAVLAGSRKEAYQCEAFMHVAYRRFAVKGHNEWFDLYDSEIGAFKTLQTPDELMRYAIYLQEVDIWYGK